MMLIGKRINGRYKIIDILGGGGMANVYLAHDVILDREVAVKILRLDFANDEEFIRRFRREAQNATSLAHPNIVNIFDVGEEDSIYYIVMEYVKGQTLKQYIQQNSPVKVEVALDIMQQLTSAIAHAHQNHIIHRDIKPQNILIDEKGNVKITDFGIAMALSATSITQTNSVLGSVHYLSPEQARGGMANKKSDIYSLGIVMFELLTGRLPFSGESAVSIALKHLQSVTPSVRRWNPSIPQSVENIVIKATAKDPFHRYDGAEEMENDLRTALDAERINEGKLIFPEDVEATKAIPVITEDFSIKDLDETLVHDKEKQPIKKTKPTSPDKKGKRKKGPVILVSIFASLLILVILGITILPDLLGPKEIEVPDVNGLELEEALRELEDAGFVIGDKHELTNEDIDEGHIIKTDPRAGKLVKEGTEVDLYISLGKDKYELLNYTGRYYDDVLKLLADKNFKDIVKNEVFDEEPAGTIIEQSVPAGEEIVPEDTILEFTVSKGLETIKLKDLTGYNEKAVNDYAEDSGLFIEIASQQEYHDTIEKGLVISQDPEPGTELHKGDKVTVILSKGKEELPFKTVTVDLKISFEPIGDQNEQAVQIYIEDVNRDIDDLADEFKISKNTTRRIELLVSPDSPAFVKVIRDGKVVLEEEVPYPQQ